MFKVEKVLQYIDDRYSHYDVFRISDLTRRIEGCDLSNTVQAILTACKCGIIEKVSRGIYRKSEHVNGRPLVELYRLQRYVSIPKADRDHRIMVKRAEGETYAKIAQEHKISRERVRQILARNQVAGPVSEESLAAKRNMMTLVQAARYLGMSKHGLRVRLLQGDITYYTDARSSNQAHYRFKKEDLDYFEGSVRYVRRDARLSRSMKPLIELLFRYEGISVKEIAKISGTSLIVLYKWLREFKDRNKK